MWFKKSKEIDRLTHLAQTLQYELNNERELTGQLVDAFDGCRRHPSYRAVRRPSVDCADCRKLFMLRDLLNSMGLAVRSGKRGPNKAKKVVEETA